MLLSSEESIKRFKCRNHTSKLKETSYIFYGTTEAFELYEKSLDTLLNSDCIDFDVSAINEGDPAPVGEFFLAERYMTIDYDLYLKLHHNLCHKLQKQLSCRPSEVRKK